jgi:hypothetical protein
VPLFVRPVHDDHSADRTRPATRHSRRLDRSGKARGADLSETVLDTVTAGQPSTTRRPPQLPWPEAELTASGRRVVSFGRGCQEPVSRNSPRTGRARRTGNRSRSRARNRSCRGAPAAAGRRRNGRSAGPRVVRRRCAAERSGQPSGVPPSRGPGQPGRSGPASAGAGGAHQGRAEAWDNGRPRPRTHPTPHSSAPALIRPRTHPPSTGAVPSPAAAVAGSISSA